jgi:hypothetical protein
MDNVLMTETLHKLELGHGRTRTPGYGPRKYIICSHARLGVTHVAARSPPWASLRIQNTTRAAVRLGLGLHLSTPSVFSTADSGWI